MSSRRRRAERRIAARKGSPASQISVPGADLAVSGFGAWLARNRALVAVLLALAVVAAVRLRLADVPLERDEGEYAYAGQLILRGVAPYSLAYNMKFPGVYYVYALILAVFGQTPWGIHAGLLLVNLATTLVLFFLGRRLLGAFGGAVAATAFAFLSLDRWIMGAFAHATHFVLLPELAALLLILHQTASRRALVLLGAGTLMGLAVMMKQHAVFFLPLAVVLVSWEDVFGSGRRIAGAAAKSALFAAGAAIPFGLLFIVFAVQGVFGRFWFWTIQYAKEYVSEVPLSLAWVAFTKTWHEITSANFAIWAFAGFGLATLWLAKWPARVRLFVSGLVVSSLLALSPGFYFRPHYFILLLPAAALLAGVATVTIERWLTKMISIRAARAAAGTMFVMLIAAYIVEERTYLFTMSARDLSRTRYGSNPFVEAPGIGAYVRDHTAPEDRIAVIGSEPEVYFYAQRTSATGYIYTYPLLEPQPFAQRMQDEMIQQIEAAHPKYVVYVTASSSWLLRPTSNRALLDWTKRYTDKCYDIVGVSDIYSFQETHIVWEIEAAKYRPRSQSVVFTLRRKSDAVCTASH